MRRRPSLLWRILLGLLLLALLFPTTSPLISFGNTPTAPNASTTEASGHPMIFEDVEESDYFYDAVRWAVEHGITEGTSDTTFAPKDYRRAVLIRSRIFRRMRTIPRQFCGPRNRISHRELPNPPSPPTPPVPGHRS